MAELEDRVQELTDAERRELYERIRAYRKLRGKTTFEQALAAVGTGLDVMSGTPTQTALKTWKRPPSGLSREEKLEYNKQLQLMAKTLGEIDVSKTKSAGQLAKAQADLLANAARIAEASMTARAGYAGKVSQGRLQAVTARMKQGYEDLNRPIREVQNHASRP